MFCLLDLWAELDLSSCALLDSRLLKFCPLSCASNCESMPSLDSSGDIGPKLLVALGVFLSSEELLSLS